MDRCVVRELAGSVGVIAAFVAIALGSALGIDAVRGDPAPAPYSRIVVTDEPEARPDDAAPTLWLVDGFNLLHVALLKGESRSGWWREPARSRVVELARGFDAAGAEVVVVFDGAEPQAADAADAQPRIVFAAPADDWLLRAVRTAPDPARVAVVTADRQLAARIRHKGAKVVSPSAFAARCRRAAASSDT
jgi:predicted RNA-binding protein with PIN domain